MSDTTRDALLKAREALQYMQDTAICRADTDISREALAAIDAALKQVSGASVPVGLPAGEQTGPVAEAPTQQQAELVAWRCFDGEGDYEYRTDEPDEATRAWSRRYGREWEPLYTAPPQRQNPISATVR